MMILKTFFSKTVVISGCFVFLFLLIGFISLASLLISASEKVPKVESKITIIAYSTQTPEITTNNPIIEFTPSPDPNNTIFSKGFKVIVKGTEGEGLRLHQSAGQESPTLYLANEGDLYIITDGPIITGGYVWWQIRSLSIETIIGWAVQDFLQVNILTQ
jgi:hypothetical protein